MARRKRPDPAHDIDLSEAVGRLQARCAAAECERDAMKEALRMVLSLCEQANPREPVMPLARVLSKIARGALGES